MDFLLNGPPLKPPDKFFKCHANEKADIVLCLLCESVYHSEDFSLLNNTKYLSDILVICPEHTDLNLTTNSKINLDGATRKVIANIKITEKENAEKAVYTQINKYLHSDQKKNRNTTTTNDPDNELLRAENFLLKQINKHLEDKYFLLNEKVNTMTNEQTTKTFAQVISTTETEHKKTPTVIIKRKDKVNKTFNTFDSVTKLIANTNVIQVKKLKQLSNGDISIKSMDEKSALELEKLVAEKLENQCEVHKDVIKHPRVKVVDIDNCLKLDESDIVKDINERNFSNYNSKCQLIHTFKNRKNNKISMILEVTSELYTHIRNNKDRLFVGYQNCRVYDEINIKPCFNCGRYGHSTKNCKNETVCVRCSGNHHLNQCKEELTIKCPNCVYANKKFGAKKDIYHLITDTQNCDILKTKVKKSIDYIDYPITPNVPAYLGKVEIKRDPEQYSQEQTTLNQQPQQQNTVKGKQKTGTQTKLVNSSITTRNQNRALSNV